jgi:hypothetical protein
MVPVVFVAVVKSRWWTIVVLSWFHCTIGSLQFQYHMKDVSLIVPQGTSTAKLKKLMLLMVSFQWNPSGQTYKNSSYYAVLACSQNVLSPLSIYVRKMTTVPFPQQMQSCIPWTVHLTTEEYSVEESGCHHCHSESISPDHIHTLFSFFILSVPVSRSKLW